MTSDYIFATGEHALKKSGIPNPGYTLDGNAVFDRKRVRAAPWRLKEWDFYQISDERLCLQLVIGHVSYAGNCNIALFDHYEGRKIFERGVTIPLPFSSMRMPESAHADSLLTFSHDGVSLTFETKDDARRLHASCEGFSAEVSLFPAVQNSITVCTPFSREHDFYFNEKINLLRAEVHVVCGDQAYAFDPAGTFSLLDWGRGVWPFSHEWYWSSANAILHGEPFGFNLGCGFGEQSKSRGTENVVYDRGRAVKLGRVNIRHGEDVLQPWRMEEENGLFEATLTPAYDRDTVTKLLFVNNRCHQMFGSFSGSFVGYDGSRISFSDIAGFAEHAVNRW